MTKHFCDLCGAPAKDIQESRVIFPNMTWVGAKSQVGQIGCVDGSWTPFISVRAVFDMHNTKQSTGPFFPDLCADCMISLLRKMIADLEPKP